MMVRWLLAVRLFLATALAAQTGGVTPGGIAWDTQGTGPALVLIHGSNLDRRMWDDVVGPLAEHHRVIRYDLRAHGRSADVTGPFSNLDDLAEVLDVAGVRRATLVGLSLGSTVALDFALAHPDRVDRLVLASPWPSGMQPRERPAYFDQLVAKLRAGDVDGAAAVLADAPIFSARPERAALARQMVLENARLFRQNPAMARPAGAPAIDRLGEVTARTLILVGELDGTDIRHAADTLAAAISSARLVTVPGANHLIPLWAPGAFLLTIQEFLDH